MTRNISNIVEQNLCCSCGACGVSCSTLAITTELRDGMFVPVVDTKKCTDCGMCSRVCPSAKVDVITTYPNLDLDQKGEYDCYTIKSQNREILQCATSGGAISTLIAYLLSSGLYKTAYVLIYENYNGSQAKLSAVNNELDVIKAAKSKYIPASIENVIADIKSKSIDKSIVVATPCQLLAIKKYLALHKTYNPDILFLGLFCDMTMNYHIYDYFEKRYGKYDVLHFRDKLISGWPGNVLIEQNGRKIDIPREERMQQKERFRVNRCRYCFDKLNMLSDISFGDCYIAGNNDSEGQSSVMVRSEKGKMIFDKARHLFHCTSVSFKRICQSQHLDEKRINLTRDMQNGPYTNIPFEYGKPVEKEETIKVPSMNKLQKIGKFICRFIRRVLIGPQLSEYIYIDNVGFTNKGDQLMIQSVVEQVRRIKPKSEIVVRHEVFFQNPSYCIANHLLPLHKRKSGIKGWRQRFAISFILNKQWLITPDMIDIILDCRGYHLGDPWIKSEDYWTYLQSYYASFSKKGRRLFLLPQALGPFTNEWSRKAMQLVYSEADAIYAREGVSYNYAAKVLNNTDKLHMEPDFTCLCKPQSSTIVCLPKKSYVLIIPNARMIDKTDGEVSSAYMPFMLTLIRHLQEKGENVCFLNHEGVGDVNIMEEMNELLKTPIPIYSGLSGVEVKAIIKDAKLLISSRFHGVVSGLSQGVPTLCTSWSHKYKELMRDYQCEAGLIDSLDCSNGVSILDDALLNPQKYTPKKESIQRIEQKVREMWDNLL